ncbi:MAG: two-component sensor histidine kinase, partial [Muribaculaceae bacterium]|nr:two-component sensor histidine kinase [Muribaculaceae bacterium]
MMRCLSSTSSYLERKETLHFLEEDVNIIESSLLEDNSFSSSNPKVPSQEATKIGNNQQVGNLEKRYRDMQEVIRSQYLYQKGLLNEVILSILRESGARPAIERADSTVIRNYLTAELESNGLNVPFEFAVTTNKNAIIYASEGFDENLDRGVYSQVLFPNTDNQYRLQVEFPTKRTYIFSSVRFIIPTLAFTLILLIIFLYTIFLAFRQKKLSEMKTDFINNMTHELKTPISTISLAAQMLNDDSIMKSPTSLKHLSQVITDESKRLRFQVEKVLQMSVFDNSGSALKFSDVDANKVVENVTHTFKIKVEKYGGSISCKTEAENAIVNVDEMHFTN